MKPQMQHEWRPIDYPKAVNSSRLPVLSTIGFFRMICRIIYAINALMRMQVGAGLKLIKAEAGWLLTIDEANLDDGLQPRWYRVCKTVGGTQTQYWVVLRGSQLYTDSSGSPGTIVPGEPFTDAPLP